MTNDSFVGPGEGRAFANGIGHARVKVEPHRSEGFAIFESEIPPQSEGPPPHLHEDYDEAFYVLDGWMSFWVGDDQQDCGPGSVVFAPRGKVHRFENRSERTGRLLVVLTPHGLQLVESLGSAVRDPAETTALWVQHRSRITTARQP